MSLARRDHRWPDRASQGGDRGPALSVGAWRKHRSLYTDQLFLILTSCQSGSSHAVSMLTDDLLSHTDNSKYGNRGQTTKYILRYWKVHYTKADMSNNSTRHSPDLIMLLKRIHSKITSRADCFLWTKEVLQVKYVGKNCENHCIPRYVNICQSPRKPSLVESSSVLTATAIIPASPGCIR